MVTNVKRIFINGFFIIVIYVAVVTTIIVVNEMNQVAADTRIISTEEIAAPAENTIPDRDITQQEFAPNTTNQPYHPIQPTN